MRIIIGCDHGGFELKESIRRFLSNDVRTDLYDAGTFSAEPVDYPDIGALVAEQVRRSSFDRGILICGTGVGMSIVANKFPGIRAALCHDVYTVKMSREHNDSNILVIGGRVTGKEMAQEMVEIWLTTGFKSGRHQRRLEKITTVEATICGSQSTDTMER